MPAVKITNKPVSTPGDQTHFLVTQPELPEGYAPTGQETEEELAELKVESVREIEMDDMVELIQDKLDMDVTPTTGSSKLVTSGGIKAALDLMDEDISSLNEDITNLTDKSLADGKPVSDPGWILGKYVSIDTNQITNGGSNLYITDYLHIPIGCYKISTNAAMYSGSWTISFYDSNKQFISGVKRPGRLNAEFVFESIPENAVYFIVAEYAITDSLPVTDIYIKLYVSERIDIIANNAKFANNRLDKNWETSSTVELGWTDKQRLNKAGEIINASDQFGITQYIEIPNDGFHSFTVENIRNISDGSSISFFDCNQVLISRVGDVGVVTIMGTDVPDTAKYMVLSHYIATGTAFSDVILTFNYNPKLAQIEASIAKIQDKQIKTDKTYRNILKDASTFRDAYFINQNGVETVNPNFCLINGFYPVEGGKTYKLYRDEAPLYSNAGHNWTWWDSDKKFISYVLSGAAQTAPDNAAYLRFGVYISSTGSMTHENFDPTNVVITEDGKPNFEQDFTNDFICRPSLKGLKWIGIGDSITEDNFRAAYHYWSYIVTETGLNFVNLGVSGSGYKAEGSGDKAFYKRVPNIATDADMITIFGGVNDIVLSNATIGTETDTGTETICGCVNSTINAIETLYPAHMPLGIISPLPCACVDTTVNLNPIQNPADDTCRMAQFVEQLTLICKHKGIPLLDLFHQSNLRPWHQECNAMYFSCDSAKTGDGLHPNGHGHRLIYRQIMDFVQKIAMR